MPPTEAERRRREYYWDHVKRLSDCMIADLEEPSDDFWHDRNRFLDSISKEFD